MAKQTQVSAATLTIRDAAKMTPAMRKSVANWLRRQARFLESRAKDLSSHFTARHY